MEKKSYILVFAFLILVFAPIIVSADGEMCCLNLVNGYTCEEVTANQCSSELLPLNSCDVVPECKKGTCVVGGSCFEGRTKYSCNREGGVWDPRPKSDVEINGKFLCKIGCCFYGNDADLMTGTECDLFGTETGYDTRFDPSITENNLCVSQANLNNEGACLYERDSGLLTCRRSIKGDCINDSSYVDFKADRLCTDPTLGANCAPSSTTNVCGPGGKVYFTDTCGNRANVYDETMFPKNNLEDTGTPTQIRDYWTYMINPSESCSYDGTTGCGNCEEVDYDQTVGASICRSFSEARENEVNGNMDPPIYGDYVCASLSCSYDTNGDGQIQKDEIYKNGEEWCAETEGTLWHIQKKPEENKFLNDNEEKRVRLELEKYNKYNVPGSRYTLLTCVDGNVYPTPCADFRGEVCMEFTRDNSFREAACVKNNWKDCLDVTKQDECEESIFCQWIPGYRFDRAEVTRIEGSYSYVRNFAEQGSCIPLFSPGFQFWGTDNSTPEDAPKSMFGVDACLGNASVADAAVYGTPWILSRNKFGDNEACITSGKGSNRDLVQRCTDNCYIIPDYGRSNMGSTTFMQLSELFNIHAGGKTPNKDNFENYCISDMKSYYCDREPVINTVVGNKADCAESHTGKRKNYPIFLTNQEWLTSVAIRAKYMGDCGYKEGIYSNNLKDQKASLEEIWVAFTKLDNGGNPKDELAFEKIYEGYDFLESSKYLSLGPNIQ
jgi:hypothetical protein